MNEISMKRISLSRLCALFANILEYPTPAIYEQARECTALLAALSERARNYVNRFLTFTELASFSRLEEIYTRTFDLQAACVPYTGCHLFGEDSIRGMFMVKLRELYRCHNFAQDSELPDHVSVMLRFLSRSDWMEESQELIEYCLIPSIKKMRECFKENDNPYSAILEALLITLEKRGKEDTRNLESFREEEPS
ncbi:MAG TPA: nitrate reductase molybdenum cofactor assembly chaperone [Nitrospiraceae bacterium]|jgi:nitrate reductase delta subunit|nr:nitrate reductase molybdenum cofactor assembly chaperone [Nitrospiraceae bacterium]